MSLKYDGISIALVLKRRLNAYTSLGGDAKVPPKILNFKTF